LPGLLKALEPNERTLIVAKPGWVDGERFVAPDGVAYGASGGEGLELDNPLPPQRAGTIAGQLEAWRIALEYGAAHHFVGMLASVSGALVQYADLDASPIITLSGKSSAGKTTALMLAASGFGCPDIKKKGLIHTLRGTDNAFEYLAARSTGTFLGLDETASGPGKPGAPRIHDCVWSWQEPHARRRQRTPRQRLVDFLHADVRASGGWPGRKGWQGRQRWLCGAHG